LIYDGNCGFCSTKVAWLRRRLREDTTTSLVPSQSLSDVELDAMSLSRRDVEKYVWVVGPGYSKRGHQAVARALREASGLWRFLGLVIESAPGSWIARPGYFLVARFRHRLPGATPACATSGRTEGV
jgi:predicted DCC family thiol-disulfide oxidoreductase YuxK